MSKYLQLTFKTKYQARAPLPEDMVNHYSQVRNAYEELFRFISGNPTVIPETIQFEVIDPEPHLSTCTNHSHKCNGQTLKYCRKSCSSCTENPISCKGES
jgi:hypothetical protein